MTLKNPRYKYTFSMSCKTRLVIYELLFLIDNKRQRLNYEIIYRLAYTMIDPFYDDFINDNKK